MTSKNADPIASFFSRLGERAQEPLLRKATGCMRFDVVRRGRTRRWFVAVDHGELSVRRSGPADCTMRVEHELFERMVTGRVNAVAAVLRGDVQVDGDWRLLVLMQRLFPGPRRRRPRRKAS